jgi:hypothetical protein
MIGSRGSSEPNEASERWQLASPRGVRRTTARHSRQNRLGRVMARPAVWVVLEATVVAAAKASWISWIACGLKTSRKPSSWVPVPTGPGHGPPWRAASCRTHSPCPPQLADAGAQALEFPQQSHMGRPLGRFQRFLSYSSAMASPPLPVPFVARCKFVQVQPPPACPVGLESDF